MRTRTPRDGVRERRAGRSRIPAFLSNFLTYVGHGYFMPAKESPRENTPSWDDVRNEASALTREMMHESLKWSRRALQLSIHFGDMAFSRSKEAAEHAKETVQKVRSR